MPSRNANDVLVGVDQTTGTDHQRPAGRRGPRGRS